MSEYQYYEFLAVDRPLTVAEQAEVRELSTRARITSTSFTNEYHWGDFRGDPRALMRRYYDAHLYLANWGTHQIMLRLRVSADGGHVVWQKPEGVMAGEGPDHPEVAPIEGRDDVRAVFPGEDNIHGIGQPDGGIVAE
jgi:hypothetical protein